MRKILTVLLSALMCLSLFGCGGSDRGDTGNSGNGGNGGGTEGSDKTVQSVELSGYKTDFLVGERFSAGGLKVSLKYSDGTLEEVSNEDYTVDSSKFNKQNWGTYEIDVSVTGTDKTANYTVNSVRSKQSIKILAIGNSFSDDSTQHLYQTLEAAGAEEILLARMYIPGCTLKTHAQNVKNNNAAYDYSINESGEWTSKGKNSISSALKSAAWDIITIQQGSGSSGMPNTYNEDLNTLAEYVDKQKTNANASLIWNMTWAYQSDYNSSEFIDNYGKNQMTMYNAIVNTVKSKILTYDVIDSVIPVGTAIQNARTSVLGDTLTRDGYHLKYGLGRYIAALTWTRALTGWDIADMEYYPKGFAELDESTAVIARESAVNAIDNPYRITESKIEN